MDFDWKKRMVVSRDKQNPRLERIRIWKDADIGVNLCEASITSHEFPKHSHEYYVIGVIAEGIQTFTHRGTHYHTPTGGMIILNPEDDHTGEPANSQGFLWRAIYPTYDQMVQAASELSSKRLESPLFPSVRVDDPILLRAFSQVHSASREGIDSITRETLFLQFLSVLITRHSNLEVDSKARCRERWVVRKATAYFMENLSENITLGHVAEYLGIDRFRLIREFNHALGLPPHIYRDCLRIREAQRLLDRGLPLVEVALAVGFTDQSHFTKRFKRQIGVTPGQYVR